MTTLGHAIVSSSLAIGWSWNSIKLGDVTNASTSSNESLVSVVTWSLVSVSVSVALTDTNIVGENVELSIKEGVVIDIVAERGNDTINIDSLEPVESHGVQDIVDWFGIFNSPLHQCDDALFLVVKSLLSVGPVSVHSCYKVSISISLILNGRILGGLDIFELEIKHIDLEVEWGLNLKHVVFVDVSESLQSSFEDTTDVKYSSSLGSSNCSSSCGLQSYLSSSNISV